MVSAKVDKIVIRLGTRIIDHGTVSFFHLIEDVAQTTVVVDIYRIERISEDLEIIQQRIMGNIQTRELIAAAAQITEPRIVRQIQFRKLIPVADQRHQLRIVAHIQMCDPRIGAAKKLQTG